MHKEKIYFLINSLEGGGAERVVTTFARELVMDYDVIIITLKSGIFFPLPEGVRHISLSQITWNPLLFLAIPYFIQRLKKILRIEELQYGVSFLEISNFVHILSRNDAVISFRTSIGFFQGIIGHIYLVCIRYLYPKAQKILVGSYENQHELSEYLQVKSEKIEVISNPIDTALNIEKSKEPIEQYILEKIQNKEIYITVGRLIREKHHHLLLDTLAEIKKIKPAAILIIAGDGSERTNLVDQARQLGIEENIIFLGQEKNIYRYLAHAHYFLYASEVEGFPNVLIEAMSLGIPIITSDFSTGAREVILGDTSGKSGKKEEYPYFGPNGIIIDRDNYVKQFLEIYPHIQDIRQSQVGIERYNIKNVTTTLIHSLQNPGH